MRSVKGAIVTEKLIAHIENKSVMVILRYKKRSCQILKFTSR
jgi:hypothetical protein